TYYHSCQQEGPAAAHLIIGRARSRIGATGEHLKCMHSFRPVWLFKLLSSCFGRLQSQTLTRSTLFRLAGVFLGTRLAWTSLEVFALPSDVLLTFADFTQTVRWTTPARLTLPSQLPALTRF